MPDCSAIALSCALEHKDALIAAMDGPGTDDDERETEYTWSHNDHSWGVHEDLVMLLCSLPFHVEAIDHGHYTWDPSITYIVDGNSHRLDATQDGAPLVPLDPHPHEIENIADFRAARAAYNASVKS